MWKEMQTLPLDGWQSETALMIARGVRRLLRARGFSSVTEQLFDRDGRWLTEWRGLCRPMDLCERDDGANFVTDQVPSLNCFRAKRGEDRARTPVSE